MHDDTLFLVQRLELERQQQQDNSFYFEIVCFFFFHIDLVVLPGLD